MDNKITEQIERILQKTKDGKIPWKYSNANVVRWTRQDIDRLFTVTIQTQTVPMAIGQVRKQNYTLTIQATNPNEIALQINANTMPSYYELLKTLFEEAMKVSQASSSDIIDKLLGGL